MGCASSTAAHKNHYESKASTLSNHDDDLGAILHPKASTPAKSFSYNTLNAMNVPTVIAEPISDFTVCASKNIAELPLLVPREYYPIPSAPIASNPPNNSVLNKTVFGHYGDKVRNAMTSKTNGEDHQKVVSQVLPDAYGDKGRYSGIVLRSTGMPHGLGRMVYDNGRTYMGDWQHGRWHGLGHATFANGDSYIGEYIFDRRHGRGIYFWSDGRTYDGEFVNDKRHGKGTFNWPSGAEYEGNFLHGMREGHGKYTISNSGYYIGNWVDGRYEGFGEWIWEDGRKYKGEWHAGMKNGQGVETYPDGRVRHDGQWKDNKPIMST